MNNLVLWTAVLLTTYLYYGVFRTSSGLSAPPGTLGGPFAAHLPALWSISLHCELDINPGFDLTSSQDLLRVFDNMAKANNQSLKGLIEPMVHNYKNPSGVSMEHTLLAIFLTTFPLYLTILLLTYWVIHLKRTYRTLQRALENSILNMDEPMTFTRLRAGSI